VAILNFNEGHEWKMHAYDELALVYGWPEIPEQCKQRIRDT
jgi:hypothetical protein